MFAINEVEKHLAELQQDQYYDFASATVLTGHIFFGVRVPLTHHPTESARFLVWKPVARFTTEDIIEMVRENVQSRPDAEDYNLNSMVVIKHPTCFFVHVPGGRDHTRRSYKITPMRNPTRMPEARRDLGKPYAKIDSLAWSGEAPAWQRHTSAPFDSLYANLHYQPIARKAGVQGLVSVEFDVARNGSTENHVVIESPGAALGKSVIFALRHIRFLEEDLRPLDSFPVRMRIYVRFSLVQEHQVPPPGFHRVPRRHRD